MRKKELKSKKKQKVEKQRAKNEFKWKIFYDVSSTSRASWRVFADWYCWISTS
jgi:hypothetical protein